MLKFLIIAVIGGTILNFGTYLNSTRVSDICASGAEPSTCASSDKGLDEKRGFPFDYISEVDTSALRENGGLIDRNLVEDGLNTQGLMANIAFWSVLAGIAYFIFDKIRDTVGNIVLLGMGAAAALVYFGVIVIG